MAQVVVEMTAEEAKLWRAQQKIISQTKELEKGYAKVSRAAKKTEKDGVDASKKQSAAVSSLSRNIKGMAASYLSANAAIQIFNGYVERQRQLSAEALEKTKELGKAQERALKNMLALNDPEIRDIFTRQVTQIQAETGFPNRALLTATIGEAFGTGALTKDVIAAVKAAAPLTVLNPEDLGGAAKGALDLRAAIGRGSIKENIAFLSRVGAVARVEDPLKLSRNLSPAVAAALLTVPEQDPQQAASQTGAIFGVFAKKISDVTGERTKTAVAQLASRMAKFFRGRDDDPGTIFGRLRVLQQNPQLAREFIGEGFGAAETQELFQSIASPNSAIFKTIVAEQKKLTFDERDYDRLVKRQSLTPELRVARAAARAEANREIAVKADQSRLEILRSEYTTALEKTGVGLNDFLRDKALQLRFSYEVRRGDDKDVERTARKLRGLRSGFEFDAQYGEITRQQFEKWAAIIDRAIANIDALSDSVERHNQASTLNSNRQRQAKHGGAIEAQ